MRLAAAQRCHLCTTNNRDGLAERLAARLWESRVDDGITRRWETCPPYWQMVMTDHARVALDMLEGR